MPIDFRPVAFVSNSRNEATDDFWGRVESVITLADGVPDEAFANIDMFSHLEIIYHFNRSDPAAAVFAGHPRGNREYPRMGIFAQRKKDRPNAIGLCTVQLVSHEGRYIRVRYLDAIEGTPVLDIKPVMHEFGARGDIKQPEWATDLMKQYWL